MSAVTFDKLYDNYNILSEAKSNIAEHSKEYIEAIEGTKGDEKEKKLAAQIISKFFKHFPMLQYQAIESIFDICEDDNSSIRIAAIKTLPMLCKDAKEYITRIADILAQLLQLEDAHEYNIACNSLLQVLKEDPHATIKCIFKQIHEGDALVREKCIKFLVLKIKTLDIPSEVEDAIILEAKKLLQDASAQEYIYLMPYLLTTKMSKTLTGQQELVNIAAQQVELDQDLDVFHKEGTSTNGLISSIKFVLPLFSNKIESNKFVIYICDHVLPQWESIRGLPQGDILQLTILRQLAELSIHCAKLENPSLHVVQIFDKLKSLMPPPPEDKSMTSMPTLDFSAVECLLFTFHRLAKQCPDFLTHDPEVLKDFRARLMYFSRGIQGCQKALLNTDKDKKLEPEDLEKQKMAPTLLSNISALIKDLFYQPPMYKCNITLSFKSHAEKNNQEPHRQPSNGAAKRHVPITFENSGGSPNKQMRTSRTGENIKIYTPPSGKFSNNFSYDNDRKGGGRFRGRGGRGRGRSSGRGWRN